nr:carbon-nitrogen hydrolase family protein [Methanobacterium lacus]
MKKKSFEIALCQMNVVESKDENLERAVSMIREANVNGATLVVLPEMFNCPYDNDKFVEYAENRKTSKSLKAISRAADENNVYVVAGSIPEESCGNIYNSSFVFDDRGEVLDVHRKIHLFDVEVSDGISFKESNTITPGDKVTVVETPFMKFGVAICFDLRFPELFRLMAMEGAKLVVVPGAFNMTTGPAHWETTIRTRAIDNQIYVVAVSPAKNDELSYVAYGHSMVVDPWGDVVETAKEEETIVYATINEDMVNKIREELPLLKNRREDIYELIKKE